MVARLTDSDPSIESKKNRAVFSSVELDDFTQDDILKIINVSELNQGLYLEKNKIARLKKLIKTKNIKPIYESSISQAFSYALSHTAFYPVVITTALTACLTGGLSIALILLIIELTLVATLLLGFISFVRKYREATREKRETEKKIRFLEVKIDLATHLKKTLNAPDLELPYQYNKKKSHKKLDREFTQQLADSSYETLTVSTTLSFTYYLGMCVLLSSLGFGVVLATGLSALIVILTISTVIGIYCGYKEYQKIKHEHKTNHRIEKKEQTINHLLHECSEALVNPPEEEKEVTSIKKIKGIDAKKHKPEESKTVDPRHSKITLTSDDSFIAKARHHFFSPRVNPLSNVRGPQYSHKDTNQDSVITRRRPELRRRSSSLSGIPEIG